MTAKLFETALGIAEPWSVASVDFDEATKVLTISIDFLPGQPFPGVWPRSRSSGARHGDQDLPPPDFGRGEVIRTLDPLHPMQSRKRSESTS